MWHCSPPPGDRLASPDLAEALVAALAQYGQLQVDLAPQVDDLLALGVTDMRPAMVERFDQALAATGIGSDAGGSARSWPRGASSWLTTG